MSLVVVVSSGCVAERDSPTALSHMEHGPVDGDSWHSQRVRTDCSPLGRRLFFLMASGRTRRRMTGSLMPLLRGIADRGLLRSLAWALRRRLCRLRSRGSVSQCPPGPRAFHANISSSRSSWNLKICLGSSSTSFWPSCLTMGRLLLMGSGPSLASFSVPLVPGTLRLSLGKRPFGESRLRSGERGTPQ